MSLPSCSAHNPVGLVSAPPFTHLCWISLSVWLHWTDKAFSPRWASKGYINLATSLFRFINSLWYFHKMSGSRCFDQFMSRQQKYWIWDLCTFPTLASFTNNFLLSQLRRKWLMRAGRPRHFSLPGWSVTPHLSNVKPHQSNNWMQVSAGTISH